MDYGWSYSRRLGRNIVSTYKNLENLFSEKKEGKWGPGGGVEIPCNYELFGPKIHKKIFKEKIKNSKC